MRRYRCSSCSKTFSESQPFEGTRLETAQAVRIVRMLAEGCGVRMISRLLGVHTGTVQNVLVATGDRCNALLEEKVKNLTVEHVEADELFSFVQCKQTTTTAEDIARGDQYIYLASDRRTKLVIAHMIGKRNRENTREFLCVIRERVEGRFKLCTDAFVGYSYGNVRSVFGHDIDFGTETKYYYQESRGPRRLFPKKCQRVKRVMEIGDMPKVEINTSHAERLNLSYRLFNKRLARATLCYSKKLSNLCHSVALTTAHFNFCRKHSALKGKTPAMEAGLTDHVWSVEELAGLAVGEMKKAA